MKIYKEPLIKKLGKTDSTFADIVNYYIEGTNLKLYNREKLLRDVRIYKNREQTRKDSKIPIVFSKDRIIRRCVTGKNPNTGRMIKFPPKSKGNDR